MRWTTQQAAEAAHLTPSGFRTLAARARAGGRELRAPRASWPDGRTPLYEAEAVWRELARRPGRGGRSTPAAGAGQRPTSDAGEQLAVPEDVTP